MDNHLSEVELDQLANLARNSGTHYQVRMERRRPRAMRQASTARRLLGRIASVFKS